MERVKAAGLRFHEGDALRDTVTRANKWLAEANEALSKTPDLKKLQALLEEAAVIPVDFSEACEEINGKVEQAHKWVEKVRPVMHPIACRDVEVDRAFE